VAIVVAQVEAIAGRRNPSISVLIKGRRSEFPHVYEKKVDGMDQIWWKRFKDAVCALSVHDFAL
jgi:hypothetical protein